MIDLDAEYADLVRGQETRELARELVRRHRTGTRFTNGCPCSPVALRDVRTRILTHPATGARLTTQADIDGLPRGFKRTLRNLGVFKIISGSIIE